MPHYRALGVYKYFALLVSVIPLQLIAYYAALHRAAVMLISHETWRKV
ncbi:hypothetical protein ABI953_19405 [Bacillus paralicheniformis]